MSGSIHFDNIDLKQGTAKTIGNTGTANVFLKASLSGITFIETTQSSNLILTTVFPTKMGNSVVNNPPPDISPLQKIQEGFMAVMSRHIFLINSPYTAQFYGFCFKKE